MHNMLEPFFNCIQRLKTHFIFVGVVNMYFVELRYHLCSILLEHNSAHLVSTSQKEVDDDEYSCETGFPFLDAVAILKRVC